MLHIVTSSKTIFTVSARCQQSRVGDANVESKLNVKLKRYLSPEVFEEQQHYLSKASIAAFNALNKLDQRNRFRTSIDLIADSNDNFTFIEGSSSSCLGYALANFLSWWEVSLNKPHEIDAPIFATGEILNSGGIIGVGYISEKLKAICEYVELKHASCATFYVCYPQENEIDIPDDIKKRLRGLGATLVPARALKSILSSLLGESYDGDPLSRWEPFKGFEPYEYEDSLRFFGRDNEVRELVSYLNSGHNLILVTGENKVGVTSLIQAGLIPKFEQRNPNLFWQVMNSVNLNTGDVTPEDSLLSFILNSFVLAWGIEALSKEELLIYANGSPDELIKKLLEFKRDVPILLFIDKFHAYFEVETEELDIRINELKLVDLICRQFKDVFKLIIGTKNFTIDVILKLGALSSPTIFNLPSNISSANWHDIIKTQAEFSGISFEKSPKGDLGEIIMEEAKTLNRSLPLVSYLLKELYELAKKEESSPFVLTYHHYSMLGGVSNVAVTIADKLLAKHTASESDLDSFFFHFVGMSSDYKLYFKSCDVTKIRNVHFDELRTTDFVIDLYHAGLLGGASSIKYYKKMGESLLSVSLSFQHESLLENWPVLIDWQKRNENRLIKDVSLQIATEEWKKQTLSYVKKFDDYVNLKRNQLKNSSSGMGSTRPFLRFLFNNNGIITYIKSKLVKYEQEKALERSPYKLAHFFHAPSFFYSEHEDNSYVMKSVKKFLFEFFVRLLFIGGVFFWLIE